MSTRRGIAQPQTEPLNTACALTPIQALEWPVQSLDLVWQCDRPIVGDAQARRSGLCSQFADIGWQVRANLVGDTLSSTGTVWIYNSAGSVNVVVDVLGLVLVGGPACKCGAGQRSRLRAGTMPMNEMAAESHQPWRNESSMAPS